MGHSVRKWAWIPPNTNVMEKKVKDVFLVKETKEVQITMYKINNLQGYIPIFYNNYKWNTTFKVVIAMLFT